MRGWCTFVVALFNPVDSVCREATTRRDDQDVDARLPKFDYGQVAGDVSERHRRGLPVLGLNEDAPCARRQCHRRSVARPIGPGRGLGHSCGAATGHSGAGGIFDRISNRIRSNCSSLIDVHASWVVTPPAGFDEARVLTFLGPLMGLLGTPTRAARPPGARASGICDTAAGAPEASMTTE